MGRNKGLINSISEGHKKRHAGSQQDTRVTFSGDEDEEEARSSVSGGRSGIYLPVASCFDTSSNHSLTDTFASMDRSGAVKLATNAPNSLSKPCAACVYSSSENTASILRYSTLDPTKLSPHNNARFMKSNTLDISQNSFRSSSLGSQSHFPPGVYPTGDYQQSPTIYVSHHDYPPQTFAQKVKLVSVISMAAFLGLFACFLTIYLVVERIWYWNDMDTAYSTYSAGETSLNPFNDQSGLPEQLEYDFLGDYQPVADHHSAANDSRLRHPVLSKTATKVFYDLVNSQVIIKTEVDTVSSCYLKPLQIPQEVLQSGDIQRILEEVSSEPYVKSIMDVETDSLYNPSDLLTPDLHGAKVMEACSHSNIFQLIPVATQQLS